jgi:hypothetical protein
MCGFTQDDGYERGVAPAHKHLFGEMTKKRCSLTCENLETIVYLHEAQSWRVGSSQAHQGGSGVSLNSSSLSSTHPSLLPGPQTLPLTLPLPPSLALTVAMMMLSLHTLPVCVDPTPSPSLALTVAITPHTPSVSRCWRAPKGHEL